MEQETKDKKGLAVPVIILLGLAATFIYPMIPPTHYEQLFTPKPGEKVYFSFEGLRDTNLTLEFVDRPGLLYSVDVEAYEGLPQVELDYRHSVTHTDKTSIYHVDFTASNRLRSVDIRLGNGVPYGVVVEGVRLNSTIEYSNGAYIGFPGYGGFLGYYDTSPGGTLRLGIAGGLVLTNMTGAPGEMNVRMSGVLSIDFDRPSWLGGEVQLDYDSSYDLLEYGPDWTVSTSGGRRVFSTGPEGPVLIVDAWDTRHVDLWLR